MNKVTQDQTRVGKTHSSMVFTLEDARQIIRQKAEQAEQEEQIPENKVVGIKLSVAAPANNQQFPQKIGAASIADILGFNPNVSKQTETRDRDPSEVPAKYRKYYKLLLKLKSDLKHGLSRLTKEHLSCGGDADVAGFDSGFALSLMSSEQEALTEIERAIERIHRSTYGICELTGVPIEAERLEVVPFTRFSKQGQEEQERIRVAKERPQGPLFEAEQSDDMSEFSNYEEE
ncbi:MAG: hypothetical protein LBJ94_00985 [Puniceicoccales bacterium]|jgi:RNA polymerase-binding transcription factor DksA|nr:hypothetical protein [Puniceicoccales bacterium]